MAKTRPEYESLSHAAARAGVSTKTLRRWISAGRIRGYRAGPRLLRVNADEIDQLMTPIPTASRTCPMKV